MRSRLALLLWLALVVFAHRAQGADRPFLDLDFEAPECGGGWYMGTRGYEVTVDAATAKSGRQSLRMRYAGKEPWTDRQFGVATQQFPAAEAAGKKIRFSGFIRTERVNATDGYAGLWWRVDGENGAQLAFDNMAKRGPHGTTPWTRYEIDLDVPATAKQIVFGALLVGDGTAWFDDLRIETGGVPWAEGPAPSAAPPTAAAVAWLKGHAIPFDTAEAGHGFADLQPLRKLIGDAHVVALGEGTHGTREFFQMKHRLTELLAGEMGFTLFAIEANMPEAYKVNDYVLTGQGDPKELLKGMYFWTWNTQEVLDMILWMRTFNQSQEAKSGKARIQFLGFDMQTPDVAAQNVRGFLAKAEPDAAGGAAEADAAYALVTALTDRMHPSTAADPQAAAESAAAAARKVLQHLEARRDAYVAHLPKTEVDWEIQNARVVVQAAELLSKGHGLRDRSMADNVAWILGQAPPGSKIVLWAHNAHVHKTEGAMGQFLADRLGKDMVVLGFGFSEGIYNAVGDNGLGPQEALPPVAGSVESYLRAAGLPRLILDLRGVPADAPAAPWLDQPRPFREIGAMAARCAFSPVVISREFDGLIYFDQTHPSALLH
ncbi:MAG TPA: erythromycin esterase family protein [Thermoanaerobaculia bacterium]